MTPTDLSPLRALVTKWGHEQATYPETLEGEYAAAAVRCCAAELARCLDTLGETEPVTHNLRCQWCEFAWPSKFAADWWESCPKCHGSFSFRKPAPAVGTEPTRHDFRDILSPSQAQAASTVMSGQVYADGRTLGVKDLYRSHELLRAIALKAERD